jgi:hypothetical protein
MAAEPRLLVAQGFAFSDRWVRYSVQREGAPLNRRSHPTVGSLPVCYPKAYNGSEVRVGVNHEWGDRP